LSLATVLGRPLAALDEALEQRATELGLSIESVHANGEAGLLEALLERSSDLHGVIVNPGSLAPIAYALADALEALQLRAVEVQLGHETRSRGKSALRRVVDKQFHGHGAEGYFKALASFGEASAEAKATHAPETESTDTTEAHDEAASTVRQAPGKTIGRRKPAAERAPPGKSIGRATGASGTAKEPDGSKGPSIGRDSTPSAGASISRALVREKLKARLGQKLTGDELASWARAQWAALQRGASAEPGQHETLEELLLVLSTAAKATDHVILAYAAKLEP
jgi:3-dehydroquinate dehydratase-2